MAMDGNKHIDLGGPTKDHGVHKNEGARRREMQHLLITHDVYTRWMDIASKQALKTDTAMADFLIQVFENAGSWNASMLTTYCIHCHSPLVLCCTKCGPPSTKTQAVSEPAQSSTTYLQPLPVSDFSADFREEDVTLEIGDFSAEPPLQEVVRREFSDKTDDSKTQQSVEHHDNPLVATSTVNPLVLAATGTVYGTSGSIHKGVNLPLASDGLNQITIVNHLDPASFANNMLETCVSVSSQIIHPSVDSLHVQSAGSTELAVSVSDQSVNGQQSFSSHSSELVTRQSQYENQSPVGEQPDVITNTGMILLDYNYHQGTLTQPHCEAAFEKTGKRVRKSDRPKPHVCKVCSASFTESQNLKRHMRTHTGEKPFVCKVCCDAFRQKTHLKRHLETHRDGSALPCRACGKTFSSKKLLREHRATHTEVRPYVCGQCKSAFKVYRHLKEHLRVHSDARPFKCSQCNTAFKNRQNLRHHERKHDGPLPFVCTQCEAAFHLPGFLKKHMKIHSEEKQLKCTVCNIAFSSTDSYDKHMDIHAPNGPIACHVCDATFETLYDGRKHMTVLHPGQKVKAYVCDQCGKSVHSARYLQKHKLLHTGEKPYTCKQCDASFVFSSSLKTHVLNHTSIRAFPCSDCEASFKTAGNLNEHKLNHTGVRKYTCKECGSAFLRLNHLKKHVKLHSGDKLCKCEKCNAAFNSIKYLNKHMLSHKEDIRPFVCEVCGKGQRTAAILRRHMRIHTGEKQYVCEECGVAFTWMSGLHYHMRYHAQDKR